MKITKEYLKKLNACAGQVDLFAEEWPRGATVNEKNIRRALEIGLDCVWLIQRIAGQAWAEYQRIEGQAIVAAILALDDKD